MALGQVTVTATTGPNRSAVATVLQNVKGVNIDVNNRVLQVVQDGAQNVKEFDLNAATTLTCVITAGVYAFTIS
jgi:hypothetical protein